MAVLLVQQQHECNRVCINTAQYTASTLGTAILVTMRTTSNRHVRSTDVTSMSHWSMPAVVYQQKSRRLTRRSLTCLVASTVVNTCGFSTATSSGRCLNSHLIIPLVTSLGLASARAACRHDYAVGQAAIHTDKRKSHTRDRITKAVHYFQSEWNHTL